MRILYILNSAGGGATQGIVEMLRNLPPNEYEAYLVIPHLPDERQMLLFSRLAKGIFVVPISWWNQSNSLPLFWRILIWGREVLHTWGHILPVWKICKLIRENKIDIVYTNTIVVLDGALAAKICGIPHIWHIKEWIGQKGRVKFGLPDWLLVKIIANLSTYIIVMTNFIGGIFDKYNLKAKVRVIYDGVNLDDFQGDLGGMALRQKLGVAKDKFVVAMSASLSSTWKEHQIFIEMAALLAPQFPEMVFAAFGPEPKKYSNPVYNRPWWYYQGLQEKVTQLGLDGRFYWAGFHADIPQMMDAIDLLVHPCSNEPFGRVAIEAMAARRPVIGTERGGIAESVVHQKTGMLVEAGNPEAFAGGVRFFMENPPKIREFGMNGREHVRSQFQVGKHCKEITRLYDAIAAQEIKAHN